MPKTLQEFFYKFSKDTVWEFGKYIGLFLIGSGGYLMKGWITAVFFTAGTFFSLAYIKNLFDKNFGVKGKLIHQSFGVYDEPIENKFDHNYAAFEVVITNCSYKKIFFKISKKSSFKIHDRTTHANDESFEEITNSINSILPKQISTIYLPGIEVPTSLETLDGILNMIFEYGEKETDLKYRAEYEIKCGLMIYEKENDNRLKTLKIRQWKITKSDI